MPAAAPGGSPRRPASVRAILAHDWCDRLSEVLLYAGLIVSPWAFGTPAFWSDFNTTQFWSTRLMNLIGYGLGGLLVLKWFIRWRYGYRPARWSGPERGTGESASDGSVAWGWLGRVVTLGVGVLTLALLGYCLIAGLNARAVYDPVGMVFAFRPYVEWLPGSFDRARTLQGFENYLALACFFWALRDWLLGLTAEEARLARSGPEQLRRRLVPGRLARLGWVLTLNGTLLAVEGLAQRWSGTNKLLWLVEPRVNRLPEHQFGPFAYRANAAQYFNLVWPLTLGLWWTLRRERRRGVGNPPAWQRRATDALPLAVALMAACAILSYSRGGALVAVMNLGLALGLFIYGLRRRHPLTKFGMLLFFGAIVGVSVSVGWDKLSERFKETREGIEGREATNRTARRMAADYPWFGTGPGTFEPVFQLYRESEDEYWPAQLHNDWLETRITFGRVGSGLIGLAFACALLRWFLPGNAPGSWRLVSLIWVALGGCLVHARFDFPLQMYSILLLFLTLCAVLFSLSRAEE
ncbi:MAG: O-antigen ligase family protein [Verrucomicrobiales bacterium]|nr:O-antigen ligase family protein [Verrucomicrobiales bacterium]